jgi:Reverse transcriptase (RNA-dependent DNA polymerase)./Integrase core domain.
MKMVENQFGRKVKCLRSDNGTEVINNNVKELLEELGVFHSKSNPYTPQQNGRIEREMRTVVEAARSVIHAKDLNENLWAEAVNYVVFTINQTGTSSIKGRSPAELWFGRRVKVECLRSFGCECYVFVQDHKRRKIEKKARKGILVGYDLDSPSYRIFLPEQNDVISSGNVIFDERTGIEEKYSEIEIHLDKSQDEPQENDLIAEEGQQSTDNEVSEHSDSSVMLEEEDDFVKPQQKLRDRRTLRMPLKYEDYVIGDKENGNIAMIGEVVDIPISKALKDENWLKAINEEYNSLLKMKTWELVEKPPNIKPLTCRWILREKEDGRFKARLVVRGFEQEEGVNYSETFSPVARHASIRLILSLAASNRMSLITFDVKTAFLHGNLKETIYMYQPEGFDDKSGRFCKLMKSLYGLKQAPKDWNETFSKYL